MPPLSPSTHVKRKAWLMSTVNTACSRPSSRSSGGGPGRPGSRRHWPRAAGMGEDVIGGRPSWQAMASVRTSIVPPGPCPPPADTPDALPVVTTSQVKASRHDFAVSLAWHDRRVAGRCATGGFVAPVQHQGLFRWRLREFRGLQPTGCRSCLAGCSWQWAALCCLLACSWISCW
jgi:hypothetical protein